MRLRLHSSGARSPARRSAGNRAARVVAAALAAFSPLFAGAVLAQGFPERPVHVIVPFPPGGPVDVLARALGEAFRVRTGQPFVVESKPGANTTIGATACKNAEPSGHTICFLTSSTISTNPILYSNLSYDPAKDLAPVTQIVVAQQLLMSHKSVPAADFTSFVRYSQANPTKLNYGTFGIGSEAHLTIEWLKAKSGAQLTHLPITGAAPALLAFERADLHALYLVASEAVVEMTRSGPAKGLAVSGTSRNPSFPDVPTFSEAGLPPLEFDVWFGMFAPAGTPSDRIRRISEVLSSVLAMPEFQQKYIEPNGYTAVGGPPEQFNRFLIEDRRRAAEMIRVSGVRLTQQ